MLIGTSLALSQSRRGVSAGGGAWTGDAWLNPNLTTGYVEGDVFDYADIPALEAAMAPRFPDYLYTTGCTIDDTVLYEGRPTLKIVEGEATTAEKYFEASNYAGLGATTEMSWQVLLKLPSTFAANRNRIFFGAGGEVNFGGEYRVAHWNLNKVEGATETRWATINTPAEAFTPLATLKALGWFAVTTRLTLDGGLVKMAVYLNDDLLGTHINSPDGDGTNLSLLDMDIDCLCANGITPDPTNNYLSVARFEYRTDNAWGLW